MDAKAQDGLAARVYDAVKAQILTGQIRSGDTIAAHKLAGDLNVSRTPAHEALKRLVNEGYLTSQRRVGYTVTPVNLDELRDLFQVRMRLETLSAELAAGSITNEHLRRFAEAEKDAKRTARELRGLPESDPEVMKQAQAVHRRFHQMIAEVAGNRRLVELVVALQDEAQRYLAMMPNYSYRGLLFISDPGHRAILDAIASRDPARAREAVSHHLRAGVAEMLEAVVPDVPPPSELLQRPLTSTSVAGSSA